ncbi:TonB family protein [Stigmatella sp. ncwal1]|uniref:TonB family protein n=1 Tax=Stigmatella ashevillensis TaxID=2995309 RepID=A0ABT5D4Z5_9BACT|nr:energy transducer TonB [Stigmatella ashevillena]MDC0708636.1 TonB family protein [Stigmatella ashevillena]
MRTILNFQVGLREGGSPHTQDLPPWVGLSGMGDGSRGKGEWGRWGVASVLAVLIHLVAFAWAMSLTPVSPKPSLKPEEPELVFLSFKPPPPASVGSAALPRPEQAPRQPQVRRPQPAVLQVPREVLPPKPPEPQEAPEQVPEAPVEEKVPEAPEAAASAPGPEAAEAVPGGVQGGTVGGQAGGLLGATGEEALDLKQVARAPGVLKQVMPQYPRRARNAGIEGLVMVRIIIGVDGRIEASHTRVIRSVPALDDAAVAAVSQWRFSPAVGHHGRPVRVIIDVPVQFSLK